MSQSSEAVHWDSWYLKKRVGSRLTLQFRGERSAAAAGSSSTTRPEINQKKISSESEECLDIKEQVNKLAHHQLSGHNDMPDISFRWCSSYSFKTAVRQKQSAAHRKSFLANKVA